MNLFDLKRIADKLLSKFPYREYGNIGIHIQANSIRVVCTGDAATVIMHSDILTDKEKECLVYEIDDESIVDFD